MSEKLIDWLSDPERLAERIPRWDERFSATREIRHTNELAFGLGHDANLGGSRRVASIPEALLSRLCELEPDFLLNKEKFYRWLDANPEYSCIRRRGKPD